MDKQNEFLKQLNRRIAGIEKELETTRNRLKKNIEDVRTVLSFGLAREAEQVTKLSAQLEVLYEQRDIFSTIFEDGDGA